MSVNFTTNDVTNTPVSGLGAGDTINKLLIAWILAGTDNSGRTDFTVYNNLANSAAAAVAAGRAKLLIAGTDDAAIAAVQTTAGASFSDIVLQNGATYIPAFQWTENKSGGGTQSGNWTYGAAVTNGTSTTTAQPTTTAAATTTAAPTIWSEPGTTLNVARFGTSVAGNAAIASDGTTINLSGETVVGDAGILYIKAAFVKEVATYTFKSKCTSGSVVGSNPTFLGLVQSPSVPAVAANTVFGPLQRISIGGTVHDAGTMGNIVINYVDTSGANHFWAGTGAIGGSWGTVGTETAVANLDMQNTEYQFILEETATQWRATVKSADGSTQLCQTAWVNWSAVKDDSNPMYVWQGDPFTSHYIVNMKTSLISKA